MQKHKNIVLDLKSDLLPELLDSVYNLSCHTFIFQILVLSGIEHHTEIVLTA